MTNEQKIIELLATLDVAITYIEAIADEDSPTLEYLLKQYDALTNLETGNYVFLDKDPESETYGKWCARIGCYSLDGYDTEAEAQSALTAELAN